MTVLIVGDVHLGKSKNLGKTSLTSNLNSRVIDQVNLLNWILERAEEKNVTDIFLTGDVFEEPEPDYQIINVFLEWLKKAESLMIHIHIILGNHDYKRIGNRYFSPLDIVNTLSMDNVTLYYEPKTISIENCGVTIIPFMDRKSLFKDSLEDAKKEIKCIVDFQRHLIDQDHKSMVIGHLALEGSLYVGDEIDDISNEIILPLDYFKDYDYVWMGHVHKYQTLSESPMISHIGSMDISDFGESEENKYIIIHNTNDNSFEKIKLPTIKLEKIKIKISSQDESIADKIKSFDLKNKIVSFEVEYQEGIQSLGKTKIRELINEHSPYIIANVSESKEVKLKENTKTKEFKINTTIDSALQEYCNNFVPIELREKFMEKANKIKREVK